MISEKRDDILDSCKRFDDVLKLFNDAGGFWDVKRVLSTADSFEQFFQNKPTSEHL